MSARLSENPAVTGVRKPVLSKDGRSALVEFQVKGDLDQAKKRIDSILATTSAAQRAHPGVRIEQVGDASLEQALEKSMEEDFSRAQTISLPPRSRSSWSRSARSWQPGSRSCSRSPAFSPRSGRSPA